MLFMKHWDTLALMNTMLSLAMAFLLGGVIGLERQWRQRTAGLRTNVLVAVGAALFVDIAGRMHALYGGTPTAIQVVAYVVSGVGFLGAGAIMREGGGVRGLNTAATLWGSAAVGTACGANLLAEAVLGALFVLMANTMLRPIVNRINRAPYETTDAEQVYTLRLIAPRAERRNALWRLEDLLQQAHIPLHQIDVEPFGDDEVEISARFDANSLSPSELTRLVNQMMEGDLVSQAYWSAKSDD